MQIKEDVQMISGFANELQIKEYVIVQKLIRIQSSGNVLIVFTVAAKNIDYKQHIQRAKVDTAV